MFAIEKMSKDEKDLLMHLETRAVDYGGRVVMTHMNGTDVTIIKRWAKKGFIGFGRIRFEDTKAFSSTHWCEFTAESWKVVHQLRLARAKRVFGGRRWTKTEEL